MMKSGIKKTPPSIDEWLKEAKADPAALQEGMFLVHNGVVRQTPWAKVRRGIDDGSVVQRMEFAYDAAKVDKAVAETRRMDGIFHVRVWLNEGQLKLGDDIMYILIGGNIRPHVINALQFLVKKIKDECVIETERYC
ncbi:MAG TPA: molybdenum cofactor biosynthesis protein MoaE [Clostridia bacterium]|nr:molybdenum cofactor biosynthesis protein MoaE [Clostridia bacterium]